MLNYRYQNGWLIQLIQEGKVEKADVLVSYDSDDDLEPYEIPEEESLKAEVSGDKKVQAPVYIRDCFEGLLEDTVWVCPIIA